jgi:lysophospholipase L1-like esterase
MARRWKSVLQSSLLVLVSLLFAFVVGEVALRLMGYRGAPQSHISNTYEVPDAVLDWRYVPNSEVHFGKLTFRYNNAGFRDVDHEVEKPPGVRRVVVVGDSVSEGVGVETDHVFARVLQSRLGQGHEVINIATSGLNTPQEVHLLEREGLKYQPDLVILNLVLNDADFASSLAGARRHYERKEATIGLLGIPINPEFKRFLKSSALLYFVKERVGNLVALATDARSGRGDDYYIALWADPANQAKVTHGFDRLVELRDQHGFELVIVVWPFLTEYSSYPYRHIHQWLAEEAGRRRIAAIDLLPTFSGVPYRDMQVAAEDGVHPNAAGHALAVDTLVAWLQSAAH